MGCKHTIRLCKRLHERHEDMFFRHGDMKTIFRQEDMKTCFLGKKAYAESLPPLSWANFVKRTASRIHPIHNFAIFVICKT